MASRSGKRGTPARPAEGAATLKDIQCESNTKISLLRKASWCTPLFKHCFIKTNIKFLLKIYWYTCMHASNQFYNRVLIIKYSNL